MFKFFKNASSFLKKDVWQKDLNTLPKNKRWLYSIIKVLVMTIKEFIDNKCVEKASALTYFSMLSIVPVMAMFLAIARGFGFDKLVQTELSRYLNEDILDKVIPWSQKLLDSTSGDVVTGISLLFLLYTILRLLENIETSINEMWHISKSRQWNRKIADYVSVMLLSPVLFVIASSTTLFVTGQIQSLVTQLEFLNEIKSGIFLLLKLLPYTLIGILFTLLYIIFPNTKVKFIPALIGGILAGTSYQINQWGFVHLQFLFVRYNAIYGSLVILPLFILWLQISWLIVLFGAQLAYAIQYVKGWFFDNEKLIISLGHTKRLMLLLLYKIIKNFKNNEGAILRSELANGMHVPHRHIHIICEKMERAGLVIKTNNEDISYLPAFDIQKMDIQTVLAKYENEGLKDFDNTRSKTFTAIDKTLKKIDDVWKNNDANLKLKDLKKVHRH